MSQSIMNVFRSDAFSTISLTQQILKHPYQPNGLGALNLFTEVPIRDKAAYIEQAQGKLTVIPTSKRGDPGTPRDKAQDKRQGRYFDVPRLMHDDTIRADEIQSVREFIPPGNGLPVVTELMQLQKESARRLSGPTGLQASMEYTRERHRLGAIRGEVLDADNTVIYNWFEQFGITQPQPFVFNLAAATVGTLRPLVNQIQRTVARKSQGAFTNSSRVMGLCGDDFWDAFINHPDVRQTYLNWTAAADLRNGAEFAAFGEFQFGGITFFNYRGSDDASTVAVPSNGVSFFPEGAPGVFQEVLAPAEFWPWANQEGKKEYVLPIIDRDRNAWFKQELYAYPLFICTRPEVLQTGTMDATADLAPVKSETRKA